jgi:uncharacterized protein
MTSSHATGPRIFFDSGKVGGEIIVPEADCACPLSLSSRHLAEQDSAVKFDQFFYQPPATQINGLPPYTILFSDYAEAGIAVLNDEAWQLWQKFQIPSSPAEVFHRLGIDGIPLAYQRAVIDLHSCGFLSDMPNPPVPFAYEDTLIAWLHTTNACNLRCNYCYLAKTNEMMDEQIGRRAIEAIFRSARANNFTKVKIKYAGGEATLNFPLVTKLHDYARQLTDEHHLDLRGVVLSNGVRLTTEMVESMIARNLRLMISLDGLGDAHDAQRPFANGRGSFANVARNIEMAKDEGLVPDICVTVSGRSAAGLQELVGWILERDLPFSLNFYRENELSTSYADLKLDEKRIIQGMLAAFKVIEAELPRRSLLASLVDRANLSAPHSRPCAAGYNYLVIDHHGRVAKCQMEINKPVTHISAPDPLAVIRADKLGVQNYAVAEKEGCRDCEWKHWCAGGCPQATFQATGRYDIQSPNCNIYKALYPEVVRLEALRLLKLA